MVFDLAVYQSAQEQPAEAYGHPSSPNVLVNLEADPRLVLQASQGVQRWIPLCLEVRFLLLFRIVVLTVVIVLELAKHLKWEDFDYSRLF